MLQWVYEQHRKNSRATIWRAVQTNGDAHAHSLRNICFCCPHSMVSEVVNCTTKILERKAPLQLQHFFPSNQQYCQLFLCVFLMIIRSNLTGQASTTITAYSNANIQQLASIWQYQDGTFLDPGLDRWLGYPNVLGQQQCLTLDVSSKVMAGLNDASCSPSETNYICQVPVSSDVQATLGESG